MLIIEQSIRRNWTRDRSQYTTQLGPAQEKNKKPIDIPINIHIGRSGSESSRWELGAYVPTFPDYTLGTTCAIAIILIKKNYLFGMFSALLCPQIHRITKLVSTGRFHEKYIMLHDTGMLIIPSHQRELKEG